MVTFHLLPISRADVILGIQWLKLLGPITTYYTTLVIKFSHLGQPVTLHVDADTGPTPISAPQVKCLLQTHSTSAMFHLCVLSTTKPGPASNPPSTIPAIETLLSKFSSIFQSPTNLPPPHQTTHHINLLSNTRPMNVCPYWYLYFQKSKIEKQVSELLSLRMIQVSQSPFWSPVLLVKKKDGNWRMCVDYHALNAITVCDRFLMPTIDELLDDLGQPSWFSKLDLRQGFHQIVTAKEDIEKIAFRMHQGHYKYRVMPFVLCNTPSMFQAMMNVLLQPFLRRFVVVFIDDILVYIDSLQSHLHHLELIFQALLQGKFYLKCPKCLFTQRKLEYLGHIISGKRVEPDLSKI